MANDNAAQPGAKMPEITVDTLDGGSVALGGAGWKAVVVYRGAHCPLCKKFLAKLDELKPAYREEGIDIIAVSADQAERTRPFIEDSGFSGTVGHSLTIEQMEQLGLYISDPRSAEEAPAPFAEPALFVVNDQGAIQILDKSNAPFARPDMESILGGIKFIRSKGYPIRGMHAG